MQHINRQNLVGTYVRMSLLNRISENAKEIKLCCNFGIGLYYCSYYTQVQTVQTCPRSTKIYYFTCKAAERMKIPLAHFHTMTPKSRASITSRDEARNFLAAKLIMMWGCEAKEPGTCVDPRCLT